MKSYIVKGSGHRVSSEAVQALRLWQDGGGEGLQGVVEGVLEQLGALGNMQGLLPPALQPALEHTLACVDEDAVDASAVDLDAAPGSATLQGGDTHMYLHLGMAPSVKLTSLNTRGRGSAPAELC